MKTWISIDTRKKDNWCMVAIKLESSRRYFEHSFDTEGKSNQDIVKEIKGVVDKYISKQVLEDLEEEGYWKKEGEGE